MENKGQALWGSATRGAIGGGPKMNGTASGGLTFVAVVSTQEYGQKPSLRLHNLTLCEERAFS
jgi:hypothetical protein